MQLRKSKICFSLSNSLVSPAAKWKGSRKHAGVGFLLQACVTNSAQNTIIFILPIKSNDIWHLQVNIYHVIPKHYESSFIYIYAAPVGLKRGQKVQVVKSDAATEWAFRLNKLQESVNFFNELYRGGVAPVMLDTISPQIPQRCTWLIFFPVIKWAVIVWDQNFLFLCTWILCYLIQS